jgi:hypothetical protein
MAMSDWKESKRILDEAKRAERDAADLLRQEGFPGQLTEWKREADATQAGIEGETQRRIAATERDRRKRERERAMVEAVVAANIDERIASAVETLREEIDARDNAFVSLAGLVEKAGAKLAELNAKLAKLERLLESMRQLHDVERAQPVDLPSWRSRPVN